MSAWNLIAAVVGRARRAPKKGFLQLSSKQGNRTFYKGKGCAPTGRHTSKGRYIIQESKLPQYIVPDLKNFELLPFVARTTTAPQKD